MEWTSVTVIVTLVGLGVAVVKPIISLTNSILKLTLAVERLDEKLSESNDTNNKAHDILFTAQRETGNRLDHFDRVLDEYEKRISFIEKT